MVEAIYYTHYTVIDVSQPYLTIKPGCWESMAGNFESGCWGTINQEIIHVLEKAIGNQRNTSNLVCIRTSECGFFCRDIGFANTNCQHASVQTQI